MKSSTQPNTSRGNPIPITAVLVTSPQGLRFFHGLKQMSGFIYVMSNKGMPELFKIGHTTRHPEERAKELYTTGVPFPFEVLFAAWCSDPARVEDEIHKQLYYCRAMPGREFFRDNEFCEDILKTVSQIIVSDCCESLSVVYDQETNQQEVVDRVATYLACHSFRIPRLLEHLTIAAWQAANQSYEQNIDRVAVNGIHVQEAIKCIR